MKHCFVVVVLVILLGCFGIAMAQTALAEATTDRTSYSLPYGKIGGEGALISIVNPHARDVTVTVVVEDEFGTRIDDLTDRLAPKETKSFPVSSLPPLGTRLRVEAHARLQVGITYVSDGVTFETRVVEPERESLPEDGVAESTEDDAIDGKRAIARTAVATTYGSTCGGQTSVGNPYPCGNGGNCTWWAWKMAKDNWGVSLPGMGNASNWATAARNNNYRVSSIPAPKTIGVNTTMLNGLGHVFWVTQVNGTQVCGTEMAWGSYGSRSNCYPTTTFNAYIYPPSITVVSPNGWEFWSRASKRTISWSSTGNTGAYVRIELLNYGSVASVIASSVPRGQTSGSYAWTIPWFFPGSGYTIRVTSTSNTKYTDVSNTSFTIW